MTSAAVSVRVNEGASIDLDSKEFLGRAASNDFTLFVEKVQTETDASPLGLPRTVSHQLANGSTYSGEVSLRSSKHILTATARVLICQSYHARFLSATVRVGSKDPAWTKTREEHRKSALVELKGIKSAFISGWAPSPSDGYQFQTSEIAESVTAAIFEDDSPLDNQASGLVIVAGATNSAKSEITRAILHGLLTKRYEQLRESELAEAPRPLHVVTYEDPLEVELFESPHEARSYWVDYTPRSKPSDVQTLEEALNDALRQTPRLFYIGEVRSSERWKTVLDFAETGHLVFCTCHAGSVSDVFQRIFEDIGAKSAADRARVAHLVAGIVHLARFPGNDKRTLPTVVPAVWRRTSQGVSAMVADGLASLLPFQVDDPQHSRSAGSIGRASMARNIHKKVPEPILLWAVRHDLRGV